MKLKKSLCVLLGLMTVMAVGCGGDKDKDTNSVILYDSGQSAELETAPTETYNEVNIFYGESASYGNMTVTVSKVLNPNIIMENSGKMAVFFEVTIDNGTDETVMTNYLNNFSLTVDGTFYDATDCFTIPVMKKLYDFYGDEAFKNEIPAGESFTGYLAAEVDSNFEEMQLHYIPKTTDRGSRISVSLVRDNMTDAEKNAE